MTVGRISVAYYHGLKDIKFDAEVSAQWRSN